MRVKLLRAARIRHEAGETVDVSPAEARFLMTTGSAEAAEEFPARTTPETGRAKRETPETITAESETPEEKTGARETPEEKPAKRRTETKTEPRVLRNKRNKENA